MAVEMTCKGTLAMAPIPPLARQSDRSVGRFIHVSPSAKDFFAFEAVGALVSDGLEIPLVISLLESLCYKLNTFACECGPRV